MLLGELWVLLGEAVQQAPQLLHSCSVPAEGREVSPARPTLKCQGGSLQPNQAASSQSQTQIEDRKP